MQLNRTNLRMVTRASWGVSVSPPMPRFEEYVARLDAPRVDETAAENPAEPVLRRKMIDRAEAFRDARFGPLHLPWSAGRPIVTQRLFAAIVSFVDDYNGPYPEELLPRESMESLIGLFAARPRASLVVPTQLDLARSVVGPHPFAAALALHGATRTLARGRDRRLGAPFDLSLEDRLSRGASLMPFTKDLGPRRDALGDTYHYWGCFAVGIHCGARFDDPARLAMLALFGVGAHLMSAVRGGVFGHELFGGTHDAVDRAGLAHGVLFAREHRRSAA